MSADEEAAICGCYHVLYSVLYTSGRPRGEIIMRIRTLCIITNTVHIVFDVRCYFFYKYFSGGHRSER